MMYFLIFATLFIFSILEITRKFTSKYIFFAISAMMCIISSIRYGMGTDYFAYEFLYNNHELIKTDPTVRAEWGYKTLQDIFNFFNVPYQVFIAIVSTFIIGMISYVIYKYSQKRVLSLTVFYAVYYGIYANSIIRQGMTLAIFLFAFYRFLYKNEYLKYALCILGACLIHKTAIITLIVIPIWIWKKSGIISLKFNIILGVISFGFMFIKVDKLLIYIIKSVGVEVPYVATGPNIMAIGLRVLMVAFVYFLYCKCDEEKLSVQDKKQIQIYYLGILMFIAISNVTYLSRLTEYFMILEIILIPNLISIAKVKIDMIKGLVVYTFIMLIILTKDIKAFISEQDYYDTRVVKYPIITIFNKEDLPKYRLLDYKGRGYYQ